MKILISFCLLIIAGCMPPSMESNIQMDSPTSIIDAYMQNPMPMPEIILEVTDIAGTSGFSEEVCVVIITHAILEIESSVDALALIQANTSIYVDWVIRDQLAFHRYLTNIEGDNSMTNIFVCFDTEGLSHGNHLAFLEISLNQNVKVVYTWAFEVP